MREREEKTLEKQLVDITIPMPLRHNLSISKRSTIMMNTSANSRRFRRTKNDSITKKSYKFICCAMLLLPAATTTTTAFVTTSSNPRRNAFFMPSSSSSSPSRSLLQMANTRRTSRASPTPVVAQPVQPKKTISDKRRRAAVEAMDRKRNDNLNSQQQQQQQQRSNNGDVALTGADAQLLEALLSAAATTATQQKNSQQQQSSTKSTSVSSSSSSSSRPRGRPECVPGAMNFETMLKFREQQEKKRLAEAKAAAASGIGSGSSYSYTESQSSIWRSLTATATSTNDAATDATMTTAPKKRGKGRPRKVTTSTEDGSTATTTKAGTFLKKGNTKKFKPIKGAASLQSKASSSETKEPKKRKRVVKNLPNPKKNVTSKQQQQQQLLRSPLSSKAPKQKFDRRSGNKNDPLNLHRYYRTELLSADEEYSLGMKIQFMMKCEFVHEGLCENLLRLPTIEEWAHACGFTEPSTERFIPTEADEKIRPAGAETIFEEQNPNMFVGNGLATHAGPGRGRGRAKKPAPIKLGNFYDDSTEKFPSLKSEEEKTAEEKELELSSKKTKKKAKKQPINRGTPLDFLEMMYTAKEAKQRMVQCNMRLVVSIARKYSNVGVNLQDLVQEGSLGLTRAAEKFEPSKGFKFSTYASWWIQQAVFRSIAYHSRTIRLPVHVHNLLNRVRRVRMTLEQDLGRSPTNEEIAEQLDMSTAKFNKMLRLTRRSISLEMPKYQSNPKDLGHESEDLLGDTIDAADVVQDESSPEKRVDRRLFHEDLREMLEILEEDERKVICARYGLSDGLTRTVTAVAAQMRESKAWVRSQECRALRKLRRPWYEKRLKEHQNSLTN